MEHLVYVYVESNEARAVGAAELEKELREFFKACCKDWNERHLWAKAQVSLIERI